MNLSVAAFESENYKVYITVMNEKIAEIRKAFDPAIGSKLTGYSTAELLFEDGTWGAWPDLPIRLEWGSGNVISVSWSKFDDLWIALDMSLRFSVEGQTFRWVSNSIDRINKVLGATIQSILLGEGEMSFGENYAKIWNRLLIGTDRGWLEISNGLDENAYDFHPEMPAGNFVTCV